MNNRINLEHALLQRVRTPGQYIGREWNSIVKDPESVEVSFAFAFPDTYAIGMSHLGLHVIYDILNRLEWAACERVFAPWPDMAREMRGGGIPLFALESRRPVRDFDIVGFSLQNEMCYTNVLNMLNLAGIPLHAEDRSDGDPIVVAGGPCTFNPEPMSRFIDAFLLGDGEEAVVEMAEAVRGSSGRDEAIENLSRIGSVYVPSLGKKSVQKAVVDIVDYPPPTSPVVPYVKTVQERFTVEIMRGCPRGCKFCHAGAIGKPVRYRNEDQIVEAALAGYVNTGFEEISFCALSAGDYPHIENLLARLTEALEGKYVNISLPSLRVADCVGKLADFMSRVRKPGLTLAPEAGTERLRREINKPVTDEDLLSGVEKACELGWDTVKLYFMIGLPGETEEDIDGIIRLISEVGRLIRRIRGGRAKLNVTISPFIPKPHTAFQGEPMAEREYLRGTIRKIKSRVRGRHIRIKAHNVDRSFVESVLAVGGEDVGELVEAAWRAGCRLDAWDEWFDVDKWPLK